MAQPEDNTNISKFLVDLQLNHGMAYRESSWAPLDITLNNQEDNYSGYIEVRLFFGKELQSPIYRIPYESPKNSNKRFQTHCFMNRTTNMEVRVFNKGRSITPVPYKFPTRAIVDRDYLALVLDDHAENYGFLSTLPKDEDMRFYRESLGTLELNRLSPILDAYTGFDCIILGDIDPGRIGSQQQEVFLQYVRQGGTLITVLGSNTTQYRDSWIADELGVTLGEGEYIHSAELVKQLFPPEATGRYA